MLNMIQGAVVPDRALLSEGYEVIRAIRGLMAIDANVGADKFLPLFTTFLHAHRNEPVFFILEVPCNQEEERQARGDEACPMHKNIYYMDGLDEEAALSILREKGELLIHDGLSSFGFGGHISQDEMMKSKYNVCNVFTKNIPAACKIFEAHGIPRTDHLVTAWETFTLEHLGSCTAHIVNGESIYDLVPYFVERGMYLAERRED